MKTNLVVITLMILQLCPSALHAQSGQSTMAPSGNQPEDKARNDSSCGGVIFDFVEQMPEFPGGKDSLNQFLQRNLKRPTTNLTVDDGRVRIRFIVHKDGSLSDLDIVREVGPGYGDEAKRVVELMPRWIAGKQNGQKVCVRYILPIIFK